MKRMGVGTSVSALLTVLLLVSGLFIVTLASQSVFSERVVELRKASEVASASAEVLQAFVYKDAETNRSLLTLRNSGAEGLEITDILAVSHEGNVVKSLKLPATLKLGPQQTSTSFLSSIAGEEFDDYETVRNTIASFYFKTFRGRVFGSMYLAPASLEIAAYSTSTTMTTSTMTSTETLTIPTITTTFTTRTITVIVDNPDHWPVETYVGVAFPRNSHMDGFPSWGFHQGLQAKDQNNRVRNVTLQDIKLPRLVACWGTAGGWGNSKWYYKWQPGGTPVAKLTDGGPTYVATNVGFDTWTNPMPYYAWTFITCGNEQFMPNSTVRNIGAWYQEQVNDVKTGTCSGQGSCEGIVSIDRRVFVEGIGLFAQWSRQRGVSYGSARVDTPWGTITCGRFSSPCRAFQTINQFADPFTVTFSGSANNSSFSVEVKIYYRYYLDKTISSHNITFPAELRFETYNFRPLNPGFLVYYIFDYYRLAYIKAVDMWNTSNVLAFSGGGNVLRVKIDRPVGLAAVYVYDRTVANPPPPPDPPEPVKACINTVNICESNDVGTQVVHESGGGLWQCADNPGGTNVVFRTSNPNDCDAFIAPGAGTYSENQLPACPKNGNTITCTANPGQTIITDCNHKQK
ncbi:MAG: hypothetical protein QXJ55_08550 [Candidatus Caldarchaeum sp.]